jgi:hypothetical protein
MKLRLLLPVLCLAPTVALAQPLATPIPVHHPQFVAYTDASQFPTIAGHLNWAPGENPVLPPTSLMVLDIVKGTLGNSTLGHAHLSLIKCPQYAELTGPISCRFAVLLFNVQAQAFVTPAYQDGIRDLVWDATGTTTPPEMIGAVGEERTWGGTCVIDPTMPSQFPTSHGWWSPRLTASFKFDNGDVLDKELFGTFYVMTDPNAPDNGRHPFVSARVSPHETRHRENWGQNLVETLRDTEQYLPIVPLQPHEVYRAVFATGGYGADNLPAAIAEQRDDSDIHHHLPGIVRQEITANGNIEIHSAFDADVMGPGTHKVVIGRRQIGLFGDQAVVSQLVFDVKVAGTATPPPPPPPPTPVLVWEPFLLGAFNVSINKEFDKNTNLPTGRLQACIGGECIIFKP